MGMGEDVEMANLIKNTSSKKFLFLLCVAFVTGYLEEPAFAGNERVEVFPPAPVSPPGQCKQGNFCVQYSLSATDTNPRLLGIWGADANNVWAVGIASNAKVVLRWDGKTWSRIGGLPGGAQEIHGVWGTSKEDVWAVGDQGTILHWDGKTWTETRVPEVRQFHGIWGSAKDDAWAVGVGGTAGIGMHWDGKKWSLIAADQAESLSKVWGSAKDDVWAVGLQRNGGVLLRWDGKNWTMLRKTDDFLSGVWGSSKKDVWVVGGVQDSARWDGTTWVKVGFPGTSSLSSVWGTGPKDVWAVRTKLEGNIEVGEILYWDGNAWAVVESSKGYPCTAVWGTPDGTHVWVAGGGRILHRQRPAAPPVTPAPAAAPR